MLRNLLYRIMLENKAPLFLQLSQCPSGEVDGIIPNTAKAELMAERMNVQIVAWCHFYWKELNLGADRFYHKLLDRAFSQVLLHKIGECTWDSSLKAVTSPSAQSEMSAIAEFEHQDLVKLLLQDSNAQQPTKAHVNPNVAPRQFLHRHYPWCQRKGYYSKHRRGPKRNRSSGDSRQ